jgi:phospholipase/carboxylesterase
LREVLAVARGVAAVRPIRLGTPAHNPPMPFDALTADLLPDLPLVGRAEQLLVLLHGWAGTPASMLPLARSLRGAFAQALVLGPSGLAPRFPEDEGVVEAVALAPALTDTLERLREWVAAAQHASGVGPAATAIAGFGEGAMAALELSSAFDGLAGRVLAFSGRYAALPTRAPEETTIHLFHGADDEIVPVARVRAAIERLAALGADATIDIAGRTGHALAPVLVDCALHRLRTHIPARTWAAALGAVPAAVRKARERGSPTE